MASTKLIWGKRNGHDVIVYEDQIIELLPDENTTAIVTQEGTIIVEIEYKDLLTQLYGEDVLIVGEPPVNDIGSAIQAFVQEHGLDNTKEGTESIGD
jgi:hypothetical protein